MRDVLQNEVPMKNIATNLKSAALISFFLVLPFAVLEFLNNSITRQNSAGLIVLFGLMWLLPMAFIVILSPIVQNARTGNGITANPINFLFRVASLVAIAIVWASLMIDQLPCFIGVPNCD